MAFLHLLRLVHRCLKFGFPRNNNNSNVSIINTRKHTHTHSPIIIVITIISVCPSTPALMSIFWPPLASPFSFFLIFILCVSFLLSRCGNSSDIKVDMGTAAAATTIFPFFYLLLLLLLFFFLDQQLRAEHSGESASLSLSLATLITWFFVSAVHSAWLDSTRLGASASLFCSCPFFPVAPFSGREKLIGIRAPATNNNNNNRALIHFFSFSFFFLFEGHQPTDRRRGKETTTTATRYTRNMCRDYTPPLARRRRRSDSSVVRVVVALPPSPLTWVARNVERVRYLIN